MHFHVDNSQNKMSNAHSPSHAGHAQRSQLQIPQFQPLPPTSFINRLINKILAPFFYLIFSIITAIIVVPVYTVIENFKKGRNSRGGQRFASNHQYEQSGQTAPRNKAKEFLGSYSSSYSGPGKTDWRVLCLFEIVSIA